MNDAWRNDPATEKQKEKLHFFGCTWNEGITKGQASDAIDECVKQFPDIEATYQDRPATEDQLAKLRPYLQADGEEPDDYADEGKPLTYTQAKDLIQECELGERQKEEQKSIDYMLSDDARIDDVFMHIDFNHANEYREVTREEVAEAWALVKSRKADKSELPDTEDLLDALEELFSDFKPKKPDPFVYSCKHCAGKTKVRLPKITALNFSSSSQFTKEDVIQISASCRHCGRDIAAMSLSMARFICPNCSKEYAAAKSQTGQRLRCNTCHGDFLAEAAGSGAQMPTQIPSLKESSPPDVSEANYDQPATEDQLEKLRAYGNDPEDYEHKPGELSSYPPQPLTFGQAEKWIIECELEKRKNEDGKNSRGILERKLLALVADGEFDKNDEKELKALTVQLGLDESCVVELLQEKFTEEFMPIKRRMEKAFVLTDQDLEAIERLKKKYDIELTLEGNAALFRSIHLIESKKQLPNPIATSLMLNSGEVAYYSIPTRWHQIRGSSLFSVEPQN